MKQSNRMMQIVEKIAAKYDFDLTAEFGHLKLTMPHMQPLLIEKHGKNIVAVLHIASDGMYDPMIRFYINPQGAWLPIEIQMAWNGRLQILMEDQGNGSWLANKFAQADATNFANDWATNIKEQGWHKDAQVELKFTSLSHTAWLIMPDGSVMYTLPQVEEGFTIQECYNLLDCEMVEIPRRSDNFLFIGDEEGKFGDYEVNELATRLARLDQRYLSHPGWGGDHWAGRCLLTPQEWFK